MPTIIETLAQLASDASLQDPQSIEQLLANNNIDESVAEAIINKDVTSLERQLDVCPDIVCFVAPAEDDENETDEEEESNEESNCSVINF